MSDGHLHVELTAYLHGEVDDSVVDSLADRLLATPGERRELIEFASLVVMLAEADLPMASATTTAIDKADVRSSRWAWAMSIAAAVIVTAAAVASYLFVFSNQQPEGRTPESRPAVATLIESTGNLITPDGLTNAGATYPTGEYALDAGMAEFMLTNAVNVRLRGETRIVMQNDLNVVLTLGAGEFIVPSDARGFTVALPNGIKVIDLGTRFVIEQAADGSSDVRVLEGAVEIVHGDERHRVDSGYRASVIDSRIHVAAEAIAPDILADWSFNEFQAGEDMVGTRRVEDGSLHSRDAFIAGEASGAGIVEGATKYGRTPALRLNERGGHAIFRDGFAGFADGAHAAASAIRFDAEDSFTVEAIVRTSQDSIGAIVANDWGHRRASWWLRVENGRARFLVADHNAESIVTSDRPINDGDWHHLAAVRDVDGGKVRIYIDGRLASEADDITTEAPANTLDTRIGQFNNADRQFVGEIDHVRITGRALSTDQFIQPTSPDAASRAGDKTESR